MAIALMFPVSGAPIPRLVSFLRHPPPLHYGSSVVATAYAVPHFDERRWVASSPPGPRSKASTRRDALPERMCAFSLADDSLGGGRDSTYAYSTCLQRPRLGQTTLRSLTTLRASPHYNFVTPNNQNSLSINMEVAWAEMIAVAGASVSPLLGGEGRGLSDSESWGAQAG